MVALLIASHLYGDAIDKGTDSLIGKWKSGCINTPTENYIMEAEITKETNMFQYRESTTIFFLDDKE